MNDSSYKIWCFSFVKSLWIDQVSKCLDFSRFLNNFIKIKRVASFFTLWRQKSVPPFGSRLTHTHHASSRFITHNFGLPADLLLIILGFQRRQGTIWGFRVIQTHTHASSWLLLTLGLNETKYNIDLFSNDLISINYYYHLKNGNRESNLKSNKEVPPITIVSWRVLPSSVTLPHL